MKMKRLVNNLFYLFILTDFLFQLDYDLEMLYDESDKDSLMHTFLGTRYATAPEVLEHKPYTGIVK